MKDLEVKIQKAARVELAYLNEAKQVSDKRDEFQKACDRLQEKLSRREESPTSSAIEVEELKHHIEHIESKVKKAERMESTYLKKSKGLRAQRYRWTQLYDVSSRELQQKGSTSRKPSKTLPPLLQSFRKALVDVAE
jgi:predicted  nucleic acid-binding Zn-ribbon protein